MPTDTKLLVWRMVANAYSFVFHNLKPFFALATIPIILTTGLWVVEFAHHGGPYAAALENHDVDAWSYLDSLANEFVWSVFAVGWHRYVLYGFRDTTAATQFYVGHRELRFFFYTVIFLVPYTVAMTFLQAKIFLYFDNPTSAAMYTALLLIILFVFWFRCFLIFPAVAVVLPPYNWSTWFEIFNDDVEVLGWQGSDIPTRMY